MATVGCCRRSRSACLAADLCAPRCGLVTPCRARGVRIIMTPGEPPAQLDDPLADLVVDVPQVRGESSSSTAASRTLPVGSAGRPTGLMRSRRRAGSGGVRARGTALPTPVGAALPVRQHHVPCGQRRHAAGLRRARRGVRAAGAAAAGRRRVHAAGRGHGAASHHGDHAGVLRPGGRAGGPDRAAAADDLGAAGQRDRRAPAAAGGRDHLVAGRRPAGGDSVRRRADGDPWRR